MSTKNGWYQKYYDQMWEAVQDKLGDELKARNDAATALSEIKSKYEGMEADYQKAIAKQQALLEKLETSENPVKTAEALAKAEQKKNAIRQAKNFMKNRVKAAEDALKKA